MLYALAVVMIGWVFFRAETLPGALAFLKAMAGLSPAAPTMYTVRWYLTPELWLALAAGAIGSAPIVPALARLARAGAAPGAARRRRVELRGGHDRLARRAARRVDHADGRAHLQPVHLFPILMAADSRTGRPASSCATRRRENLLVALLFVVLIALPLASNLTGHDGADAQAENRELAPMPSFDGIARARSRAFPTGLSSWFEDHFGFRARLIRWYGESRLFVLHVSPSPAVVDGRRGWLFYGDDGGMEDYANQSPLSREEVDVWRAALVRARDWLASRGVAYVFTIAPDKHVIYPDDVPDIDSADRPDVADGSGVRRARRDRRRRPWTCGRRSGPRGSGSASTF